MVSGPAEVAQSTAIDVVGNADIFAIVKILSIFVVFQPTAFQQAHIPATTCQVPGKSYACGPGPHDANVAFDTGPVRQLPDISKQ